MKYILIIISFALGGLLAYTQDELENIHLDKSEMHGGMPSSGSSTTMSYTYVAKKAVKMVNVTLNDAPLMLAAKDTLKIYFITHNPGSNLGFGDRPKLVKHKDKTTFASYFRNGAYHLSVNTETEFISAATYRFKKKKFVAKRKTEIDSGESHFAP